MFFKSLSFFSAKRQILVFVWCSFIRINSVLFHFSFLLFIFLWHSYSPFLANPQISKQTLLPSISYSISLFSLIITLLSAPIKARKAIILSVSWHKPRNTQVYSWELGSQILLQPLWTPVERTAICNFFSSLNFAISGSARFCTRNGETARWTSRSDETGQTGWGGGREDEGNCRDW